MVRMNCLPLALIASFLLGGCGDGDGRPVDSGPKTSVKTYSSSGQPSGGTSDPKNVQPAETMTNAEARQRAKVEALRDQLRQAQDSFVRADLLGKAKALGTDAKLLWPAILETLRDEEPITRSAALEALAAIDPAAAMGPLQKALADEEGEVRAAAATGWGAAKISDLGPLFHHLETETDARVQLAVMQTIEKSGLSGLAGSVAAALPNLDPIAAKAAVRYLLAHKAQDHGPKIAELLNWRDAELRELAAGAVQELGVRSKEALLGLARALSDDTLAVRKAAHGALKSLTGKDIPYDPQAPEEALAAAARAWREAINEGG